MQVKNILQLPEKYFLLPGYKGHRALPDALKLIVAPLAQKEPQEKEPGPFPVHIKGRGQPRSKQKAIVVFQRRLSASVQV